MFEPRSPLESLAAFAIAFVAGILTTILVKHQVKTAANKAVRSEGSG